MQYYLIRVIKNNIIMYSSCPNVIKHFVPIKFSQASIDYITSPPKIKERTKQKQIPFTNKKLQCLKNDNKDYVLIFKNKSYKQYSPKKKVRFSSLIKQMKLKNEQAIKIINKEDDYLSTRIALYEYERVEPVAARRVQSMDKQRQYRTQFRNTKTSTDRKRVTFMNKNIAKQVNNIIKNTKQNKQIEFKNRPQAKQRQEKLSSLINFKIRGSKAPQSQTVDFYKQIKLDNNYIWASKLIK